MSDDSPATSPARRTTRRRVATRAQLLEAAATIFGESGTTNVSVEEICSRAGYTRGAFYSNFKTVDDLFFSLYEERAGEVERRLESMFSASMKSFSVQSIEQVVHEIVGALPADREWFAIRAVFMAQAAHRPEIEDTLRQHAEGFRAALQPLLMETINHLGRRLLLDPATFTRAVIAAHVGAVSQGIVHDDPGVVREAAVRGVLIGLTEAASCQ